MSKKKPTVKKPPTSAEYLQDVVSRQMSMLAAYKVRQDDIVRGLRAVQAAAAAGSLDAAKEAIAGLLDRDLKQAKDRQDNHAFALDIAIKALEESAAQCGHVPVTDALSRIEVLVPEAFEKTGVTVASGAT